MEKLHLSQEPPARSLSSDEPFLSSDDDAFGNSQSNDKFLFSSCASL